MGKKIGLIGLIGFMASVVMAQDVSKNTAPSFSSNNGIRLGGILGGTSILGLTCEYPFGGFSVGANIGFKEGFVSAVQAKMYLFDSGGRVKSRLRPYFGAGILEEMTSSEVGDAYVTFLNFPTGCDFNVSGNNYIGVELDINYPIAVSVSEDSDSNFEHKVSFTPGFYYKWQF